MDESARGNLIEGYSYESNRKLSNNSIEPLEVQYTLKHQFTNILES